MSNEQKSWESYEEVAQYLLDRMADQFGLVKVEGKQEIVGHQSGTTYEIDAKGIAKNGKGFIIIECRRYTTSKQKQANVAALAYQIIDTHAKGGILVSPLGLQEGAQKIAQAEKIVSVRLGENSTSKNYVLQFLNNVFVGVTDDIQFSENIVVKIINPK